MICQYVMHVMPDSCSKVFTKTTKVLTVIQRTWSRLKHGSVVQSENFPKQIRIYTALAAGCSPEFALFFVGPSSFSVFRRYKCPSQSRQSLTGTLSAMAPLLTVSEKTENRQSHKEKERKFNRRLAASTRPAQAEHAVKHQCEHPQHQQGAEHHPKAAKHRAFGISKQLTSRQLQQ